MNKSALVTTLLLVATLAPLGAAAQSKPHVYYVPAVARAAGIGNSFFVSNVRVFNKGAATANVDAYLLPGGDNSAATPVAFTVAPNRAASYDDVLQSLFGRQTGAGAMRIESDQPLLVSSHLENRNSLCPDRGGTTGQYLPGVARGSASTRLRLPHLTSDSGHRANLGIVNTAGATANVTILLRDLDSGQILGDAVLRVAPHGWSQVNAIVDQFFIFDPVPNGMLELTSDVPLIAYLSLLDNTSNDAFTVLAETME